MKILQDDLDFENAVVRNTGFLSFWFDILPENFI